MALTSDGDFSQGAPPVGATVDTVGAGDAFSAVLALGIHRGWPMDTTLARAAEFAGEICRIRGATIQDRALYHRYLERWNHAS